MRQLEAVAVFIKGVGISYSIKEGDHMYIYISAHRLHQGCGHSSSRGVVVVVALFIKGEGIVVVVL
jgi:hypothetical protein